jgi:hypothetical protein
MAYAVEFRRLRAAKPVAGDGVDFFGFTALSRGVRLIASAEPDEARDGTSLAGELRPGAESDMA